MMCSRYWFIHPATAISTNRNGSRTLGISFDHYRGPLDCVTIQHHFNQIQLPGHTPGWASCARGGHGKWIAQKYDGSGKRGPGRPRTAGEIEALVVRMAEKNRDWGYRRVEGALSNLGHGINPTPIGQIMDTTGLCRRRDAAPERSRKTTWKEFLVRHWELIVAADFFTVEVGPGGGLSDSWCSSSSSWRRARWRSQAPHPSPMGYR